MLKLGSVIGWISLLGYALLGFTGDGLEDGWRLSYILLIAHVFAADLIFLFSKERVLLSRSSQGLVLAAILVSPLVGFWALVIYFIGTLFLLGGKPTSSWPQDLGITLAPLAATGLLAYFSPVGPIFSFAATQVFLFYSLLFETKDKGLKSSFLSILGAPGVAIAALYLVQNQALFLPLLLPILLALSQAGDKEKNILKHLLSALTDSRSKLKDKHQALRQSKQKLSQMAILMKLSQRLAASLEPEQLRSETKASLQQLGVKKFRFSAQKSEKNFCYDLGPEQGFLEIADSLTQSTEEGVQVLGQLLSTNLQNAKLHSQIVNALDQLKISQAQLISQNQMAAAGRVAAGVAHEVNTPLGAIKLSLESGLRSLERAPEKVKPKLERALKAVEKASLSVERILYYSRPAHNEPSKDFSSSSVVEDCLELLEYRFTRQKVKVENQVTEGLILHGVEHDFYSLLSNLLLNGAEAVEGCETRVVRLVLEPQNENCLLTVEDSGPGVPPHLADKIFESFFTTKGSGKGTGLGLHLVSEVVGKFGGLVKVGRSHDLGGARFVVKLPLGDKPN